MRVALIGAEMLPLPAIKGGSIEEIIDGITPFIASRHELTIVSIADPQLPSVENREGVRYIRFPKRAFWSSIGIFLNHNKNRYDLIHVFNRPAQIPALKKASPASKFILDVHNEVFSRSMVSDIHARACVDIVNTIISVSNYLGRTVARRVPEARGKLQTIYSGVDLNRYQPVWKQFEKRKIMRRQLGLEGKRVILYTGRVLPKKGPHLLVEALKILLSNYPDTVLLVVGSPWYSSNKDTDYTVTLRRLAEPIKNSIVFTNFIPPQEMHHYYLAGDIFVCPSQWQEPAGRVHYEAMATGLPVVTVNRGGIPEIVTNMKDGLVINNYRNPKAFSAAIESLLDDPVLADRLAKNGRLTAEKRFGFVGAGMNYLKVYEKVENG